jgi:hypothetical protein
MKYLIYFLMLAAVALVVFNATRIDFGAPFEGDSQVAIIGVLAAASVIVLLLILLVSRTIAKKRKGN